LLDGDSFLSFAEQIDKILANQERNLANQERNWFVVYTG
jgi:hypothetical protein